MVIKVLKSEDTLISIYGKELTNKFHEAYEGVNEIKTEDSSMYFTNDDVDVMVIFRYIDMAADEEDYRFDGEIYILINIK